MGETGLEFGVLGPLQLSVEGTPLPLGAPKQRAVLAMLVINRNRPVGVESLINAVWDQSPVPAARASIQSYVSNLRRLLGDAGIDPHTVLAAHRRGIDSTSLTPTAIWAVSSSKRPRGFALPPRADSNRPVATSRPHWPNGARRSLMTCAISHSSRHSPPR